MLANFHHESVLSTGRKIIQSLDAGVDKEEDDDDGERGAKGGKRRGKEHGLSDKS